MPGVKCFLCKITWHNEVAMFAPPSDDELKTEWDAACGVEIPQNSKICAQHFADADFSSYGTPRSRLLPDAIPTINLTVNQDVGCTTNKDNYKKARASSEQLLYYVRFAREHPAMLTSKYATVKHLWAELAEALNAKRGVQRTPEKWKDNLMTWRGQMRCRARQGFFSGIPEFDKFAENDFGLESTKRKLTEDTAENTNDEPPIRKIKVKEGQEANHVSNVDPLNTKNVVGQQLDMLDVEVKDEIILSDDETTCHLLKHCTSIPEYDSEAEDTLEQATETDIKTEIDIEDDEKVLPAQKQQKPNLIKKNVVNMITLPILGLTTDEPSSSVRSKSAVAKQPYQPTAPPPTSQPKRTNVTTHTQKQIAATDSDSETCFVVRRSNTNINTSESSSNAAENEVFIIEEVTQSTSQPPTPAAQSTKYTETKRQHTLNKMYDTVLKSIERRDQGTDNIIEILKNLTAAVTQLADNVKRLEEKLT